MRILATAKEVALVEDAFELSGNSIDERYLTYELNEWDSYAIEEAVQIKEAADEDVEVVVAAIGPERSEETIRQALAKEADRAVRVWDDSLAQADMLDIATKARLLAGVVEDEVPDLVLTGVQSGDDSWGATGVALAREADYEWAAVVNQLDVEPGADSAQVHRELEGGVEEVTNVDLPAVLTIQTGINEPRYASLRGIRQAQSKPLDIHTPADLGVEVNVDGALQMLDLSEPETESDTAFFEGNAEAQAAELAGLLADEGVVEG